MTEVENAAVVVEKTGSMPYVERSRLDDRRYEMIAAILLERGYRYWLNNPGLFRRHLKLVYALVAESQEMLERGEGR